MGERAKVAVPIWGEMDRRVAGAEPQVAAAPGPRVLRVGLVNNMSEPAFEETHDSFAGRLLAGAAGMEIELRCYRIRALSPEPAISDAAPSLYGDIEDLYRDPPDALVVTGTEPVMPELTDERYWADLATLLNWAEATVPSTWLSCLAAHCALRALDQTDRVRLSVKRSGVFPQPVNQSHPLGRGLGGMTAVPHSRWNEVPGGCVQSVGYEIVIGTAAGEWTVAARERAGRMLVLVQGHPEYAPTLLLREYRRDMRRYIEGTVPAPPRIPTSYVDEAGEELLRAWSASAERLAPDEWIHAFPMDAVADHLMASWVDSAVVLFANWLEDARARACSRPLTVGRARA
ncbi:MAG: homoserine O-acetyltransferase/O-succinyltransferase family protein [Acidimicrobiales bacterium]